MPDCAKNLLLHAQNARERAYAPYSHFHVGAALLGADGNIYTGCNIENASYGAAICAERTAIAVGIHAGCQHFVALAIVGGARHQPATTPCLPCGICRQVLAEFCADSLPIYVQDGENIQTHTLGELLPHAFRLDTL